MPDKRILIVEDETIVAMTLEDALHGMGYSVAGTVSTAEDAIRKAGETRPDLILMDIRIQGEKDGIAASEEINGLYHIPIVYLTAHSDEKTLERAMKTQPYGYLIKPFRDRELYSTIEIALYKHRLRNREDGEGLAGAPVPAETSPAPGTPAQEEAMPLPVAFEKVILEVIDIPVFVLNRDMHLVYFNAALERFFRKMGYLAAGRDRSVFDLAPSSFLGTPKEYREIFLTRRISRAEKTIVVDDRRATYSLVRMPLLNGDEVRFVAVIFRDVSRELGSEQKLREMHESYEKMLGQIGEITLVTGDDKDPKMQKIAGIVSEMVITMTKMDPQWPKAR
jgi:two-component system, response regulator PdtaR